jgi:hypothetical protein
MSDKNSIETALDGIGCFVGFLFLLGICAWCSNQLGCGKSKAKNSETPPIVIPAR